LTLIQTKRSHKIPVVLYGKEFWKHVINWNYLLEHELIDESDLNLFYFSDSPEDTIEYLKKTIDLSLTDNLNIKR
jgi:predicted Rossmann-fold nucleotide-binding protein